TGLRGGRGRRAAGGRLGPVALLGRLGRVGGALGGGDGGGGFDLLQVDVAVGGRLGGRLGVGLGGRLGGLGRAVVRGGGVADQRLQFVFQSIVGHGSGDVLVGHGGLLSCVCCLCGFVRVAASCSRHE